MLQRLHLVRHGEVFNPGHVCYANLPGFVLSETGRLQAAATAERLADREPDAVVITSPLERAVETAQIIAGALGAAVATDERLTEFGLATRWAGVVWEDLPTRFPGELEAYLAHPHDLPFSPESIADVAQRMLGAVGLIRNPSAIVVSHQDPVQALRLELTGRPLSDLPLEKPHHAEIITLVRHESQWTETERWAPDMGDAAFPPQDPR